MTRQYATAAISLHDPLPVTLKRMATLAASVLGEHTDDADLSAMSASAWPCERVVLTAHNLAVI